MRIVVRDIDEFCCELVRYGPDVMMVRARDDHTPHTEDSPIIDVGLWATALVSNGDQQFLLEFGQHAGQDSRSDPAGTERVKQWREKLEQACRTASVTLGPGKIELY